MGKKKPQVPVWQLPVMKGYCATCPFKPIDSAERWQDPELACAVIDRTLFKGQQICHGTEKGKKREPKNRCKGSYDYNYTIYERMGMGDLIIKLDDK